LVRNSPKYCYSKDSVDWQSGLLIQLLPLKETYMIQKQLYPQLERKRPTL